MALPVSRLGGRCVSLRHGGRRGPIVLVCSVRLDCSYKVLGARTTAGATIPGIARTQSGRMPVSDLVENQVYTLLPRSSMVALCSRPPRMFGRLGWLDTSMSGRWPNIMSRIVWHLTFRHRGKRSGRPADVPFGWFPAGWCACNNARRLPRAGQRAGSESLRFDANLDANPDGSR